MPNADLARKMWRTLEPYHGLIYFTPHAEAAYAALGIRGRDGYFASRSAPLGAVGPEVVIATFFNFYPGLVHHAIPAVWEKASPEQILAARLSAADGALREILGDAVDGDDVIEAATLAETAARRRVRPRAAPSTPATRSSPGPTTRTSCCGTRSRCCGSSAATGTSPPS